LAVSLFSQRINRRLGILISLSILSIPTALLAVAPDLTTFTALRIAQGLCMASAFTLTLAYLGEECSAAEAGGAFAAEPRCDRGSWIRERHLSRMLLCWRSGWHGNTWPNLRPDWMAGLRRRN